METTVQENRKRIPVPVRCAAKFDGEQWLGICLNFDIAVQGNSLEEVESSMKTAVRLYLESFEGESFETLDALMRAISRPVPLSVSVPIYCSMIFHSVVSMFGGNSENRLSYYNDIDNFCPA